MMDAWQVLLISLLAALVFTIAITVLQHVLLG
jgi:hypothetical protein